MSILSCRTYAHNLGPSWAERNFEGFKRHFYGTVLNQLVLITHLADAFGSLMSTPESTNGVVTACPGDPISITCTHNITIGAITEWRLPGVSAQCLVVHGSPNLPICAPFTVTMVSGGSTLSSTVEITATEGLSGEVECLSGQNAALVSVLASINISVAGEMAS